MNYTALYRKYRPQLFNDVIGQDNIVRTLINQCRKNKISHAYLFSGTRGTGKTSLAKIFAKSVNCLNNIDGEACGECQSCIEISQNRSMNVIEIDAASNNGVDNIRDIREEVKYPPTVGNYKVYIIDEVHMLTTGAFNALLKTLEEPPPHIVFILATTDPQKIPQTVLSRCQRYDFNRISNSNISEMLKKCLKEENALASEDAINYIASISDGSMRDALSLLDRCVSYYNNEEITLNGILEITGAVSNNIIFTLTNALKEMDSMKLLQIVDEIIMQGRDVIHFINECIMHFRSLIICKSLKEPESILNYSNETIDRIKEQSKVIEWPTIMSYINEFSELQNAIKYSTNPRMIFEITLLKITNAVSIKEGYEDIYRKIERLELQIEKGVLTNNKKASNIAESLSSETKDSKNIIENKIQIAVSEDINSLINGFMDLIKDNKNNISSPLYGMLYDCEAATLDGNSLLLICGDNANKELIENRVPEIKSLFYKTYKKEFTVKVMLKSDYISKSTGIEFVKEDNREKVDRIKSSINSLGIPIDNIKEID